MVDQYNPDTAIWFGCKYSPYVKQVTASAEKFHAQNTNYSSVPWHATSKDHYKSQDKPDVSIEMSN